MIFNMQSGGVVPDQSLEEQTITPGTSDQVIAARTFLKGALTIAGDADLIPGNIAKGINIFDVTGTFEGAPDIEWLETGTISTTKSAGQTINTAHKNPTKCIVHFTSGSDTDHICCGATVNGMLRLLISPYESKQITDGFRPTQANGHFDVRVDDCSMSYYTDYVYINVGSSYVYLPKTINYVVWRERS